jgi:hypothetical protein
VAVTELRQHLNLSLELMNTLLRQGIATLDSHLGCSPINLAMVNFAKSTHTKNKGLIEVVCCSLDLSKREMAAQVGWQR